MPNYSHRPPEQPNGPALPIRRTPAYKPLVAIVTSDDLVGCYTHFHKGHTVPCEAPDCEACNDGLPYRWHAYLSAVDRDTGLHFIFECTAQAAENFVTYRDAHGTLRGCCFQAQRLNQRPNGRVIIQTKPYDVAQHRIPNPPEITKCLAILWSLPTPDVYADGMNPDKKTTKLTTRRNNSPPTTKIKTA